MILTIAKPEIAAAGPGRILTVLWRQWRAERELARRGVHFRATEPEQIRAAYAAMSQVEFDAINARQEWANWRIIPRALSGHVPDRPLRVLDLGCGSGSSTQVLAYYCPIGSHITGFEIAEPILDFARRRRYPHRSGALHEDKSGAVDFICQGVAQSISGPSGAIDVINASGMVGHHLRPETMGPLLIEMERVLHPDGVAMLDVGPTIPGGTLRRIMAEAGFACLGHYRSWLGDPNGEMLFRRQN
jgi:SAM-dependent methyltransferase